MVLCVCVGTAVWSGILVWKWITMLECSGLSAVGEGVGGL